MAAAIAARSAIRSATERISANIFRAPVNTNCLRESPISPPFAKSDGRSFSAFSPKTRKFRFQRRIDMKRSTSATGIVERIEYDPNRNSRIALIRWEGGGALQRKSNPAEKLAPPQKALESTAASAAGVFQFSSLPGLVDDRSSAYFSNGGRQTMKANYVMVGENTKTPSFSRSEGGSRVKTSAKDVFAAAFSSKAKGENGSISISSPRIAVAGSRPDFFVLGEKDEVGKKNTFSLGEVQKWKKDSTRWDHRIKRKGAVSWISLMHQETKGSDKVVKAKNVSKAKEGKRVDDRAPVTYILATHHMKKGSLVMNWCEPSAASASQTAQYSYSY